MKKKTLILNSAYYPINVVGWKTAMAYYFDTDNTVLETYKDQFVYGVKKAIPLPAVIMVDSFNVRQSRIKFKAETMFIRDGYRCSYCGEKFPVSKLEVEHIMPKSRGGATSWLNCTTACRDCNGAKSNRTPEEACMSLLFPPYVPRYDMDFFMKWNGFVYDEWKAWIPEKAPRESVKEIIPELKYGRRVRKDKK